jgi:hypothetical protein
MSVVFLPIKRDEQGNFFVMQDNEKKLLDSSIPIYKTEKNGYIGLASLSQNPDDIKLNFKPDTYFVKTEDKHLLLGGNKTKLRQYRNRSSSKKRVASRRRNVSRRRRGRQTRYSRRK